MIKGLVYDFLEIQEFGFRLLQLGVSALFKMKHFSKGCKTKRSHQDNNSTVFNNWMTVINTRKFKFKINAAPEPN